MSVTNEPRSVPIMERHNLKELKVLDLINGMDDAPRKRCKISRACDSCRRKKIRCNGQYSTSQEKVTKPCDGCTKVNEKCTFSRIPLKRGPTKGSNKDGTESRTNQRIQAKQEVGFPDYETQSQTHIPSHKIVLPPLINTLSNGDGPLADRSFTERQPALSPSFNIPYKKAAGGEPFWKVPYEMPEDRRYSIDSMSSSQTSESLTSKPPARLTFFINNDYTSDSDLEDYQLAKSSRRESASLSPKNSISSMSSLNGRISRNLKIYPDGLSPNNLHGQKRTISLVTMSVLEANISVYYAKFHPNFPILPFDQEYFIKMILSVEDDLRSIDHFSLALHALLNHTDLLLDEVKSSFSKLLTVKLVNLNQSGIMIHFSILMMLDYALLLNGTFCKSGVACTLARLNDLRVLENFMGLIKGPRPDNLDKLESFLPKMYLLINIIDNIGSLMGDTQACSNGALVQVLFNHMDYYLPLNGKSPSFVGLANSAIFHDLVLTRDISRLNKKPMRLHRTPSNCSASGENFEGQFTNLVSCNFDLIFCIHDFVELLKYTQESIEEDFMETILDNQLKLIRLMKKVSSLLISFSKYMMSSEVNPALLLSYTETFKIIHLCKIAIDCLIKTGSPMLIDRCTKINHDLFGVYEQLNSSVVRLSVGPTAFTDLRKKLQNNMLNFELPNESSITSLTFKAWRLEFLNSIAKPNVPIHLVSWEL